MVIKNKSLEVFDLIEDGNIACLTKFIPSDYDVNVQIEDGFTPLMLAASLGNLEIVKRLVEAGADVNQIDVYGTSPLMFAADQRFFDVFNYLAPLTSSEIKGVSLLTSTVDGDLDIVKALISIGINVNEYREKGVWNSRGRTALIISIQEGHLEIVKILLKNNPDPNLRDEDSGTTPLISAIRSQNIEIVFLLLAAGADINRKDNQGNTALTLAKEIGNTKIIQLLIDVGIKED